MYYSGDEQFHTEKILFETASTLVTIEKMQMSNEKSDKKEVEKQRRDSKPDQDGDKTIIDDEKVSPSIFEFNLFY